MIYSQKSIMSSPDVDPISPLAHKKRGLKGPSGRKIILLWRPYPARNSSLRPSTTALTSAIISRAWGECSLFR